MKENKQVIAVGKVVKGRMTFIAAAEGRVVGYSKPAHREPVSPTPVQEPLDVPDFMKAWTKENKDAKRLKRIFKAH